MKIRQLIIALALTLAGLALALARPQVARADGPIYIDRDAPGPIHDGLSWTTAYINVQDGLDAAIPGDELWVAEGVYTPTNTAGRDATFQLVDGIPLYGGFGGYGISETLRSQRDWATHVTVLSGDLDGNDVTDPEGVVTDTANITGTNAYHVVTGSGVTDTAVLDGFTVTGGRSYPHLYGGGMYNSSSNPTLTNVTFSGNHADGGGMYNLDSDPTLTNVTFSGNRADYGGGGMRNDYSDPTLINVTFSGNHADYGGGMYNEGSNPTLINVTFSSNYADYGGGMYNWYSDPTLTNATFSGNHADERGGGMYNHRSGPTLSNVTFSGNHADDGGGGMYNYYSNPTLSNCIVWGNTASYGPQICDGYNSIPTVNYSLVEDGYSGAGNLDADPQFVDADGPDDVAGTLDDNLRLLPASPAVDVGDNTAVPTDTLDLDGDGVITEPLPFDLDGSPRFVDVLFRPDAGNGTPPIVDMGAYEANPRDLWIAKAVFPTTPRVPGDAITYTLTFANAAAVVASDVVITDVVPAQVTGLGVISSSVAITRITGLAYAWSVQDLTPGAGGVITLTGVVSPGLTSSLNFTNTAVIATTAVDTDTTNNRSSVRTYTYVPEIIYVDADAPGVADGSSWTDAFANVHDALALAESGDEIWVAEGVYTPTNVSGREATFQLVSGVALYGGFGGYGISETLRSQRGWVAHVTVLSGDLDGNDVTDSDGVVTDTANITGTNAYHVVTGSGTDGAAVLDGFTVTGGQAGGGDPNGYYGGGMYNSYGHPTLINITFSGNHANSRGGGMYNYDSDPTLINVTFGGNIADGYGGGGMSNLYSDPTLINVTFSGNHANYNYGGGMSNLYSNPTLTNVTFSINHADDRGGGMYNDYSHPMLTNVIFSGNHADERGGGMYNYESHPTLTNVIFSGNHANDGGGGMYNYYSSPTLSNCILWGNTAPDGPQIYDDGSTPTVNYSLVQGGYSGTGNLDADPLFVDLNGTDNITGTLDDNLRLLFISPAIDAGDNTAVPIDTLDLDGDGVITEPLPFDLDGNPRFIDVPSRPDTGNGTPPIVDMGAYETTFSPELIVVKTVNIKSLTGVPLGGVVTYTLVISNSGDEVASGVVVTDPMPLGLTFGEWLAQGSAQLPPPVTWGPSDVAAYTAYTISFTANVTENVDFAGQTITNMAYFGAANHAPGASNPVTFIINQPPVADAGEGHTVVVSSTVTLDGSGSYDPDGDDLAYGWMQTGGDTGVSFTPNVSVTTFTAPGSVDVLTFTLTVTDTGDLIDTATVVITVSESYSVYLPLLLKD